jgi:hypothetical protein
MGAYGSFMILASILTEIHDIFIKAGWDDPWYIKRESNCDYGSQMGTSWPEPPPFMVCPNLLGANYHHHIGDTNYALSIYIEGTILHLDYEDSGPDNWGDLTKFTFDLTDPNSIGQIKAQAAKPPYKP